MSRDCLFANGNNSQFSGSNIVLASGTISSSILDFIHHYNFDLPCQIQRVKMSKENSPARKKVKQAEETPDSNAAPEIDDGDFDRYKKIDEPPVDCMTDSGQ